jgi:hypothetical protein
MPAVAVVGTELTETGNGVVVTVRINVFDALRPMSSTAVMVIVDVPPCVSAGVPPTAPVEVLKVIHEGEPEIDQVYGVRPPLIVGVPE